MQHRNDPQAEQQFAEKLLSICTGCLLTKLVDIGYEVGLFEAGAKGPGTSGEIAGRAGLNERYVREWLGAMTTAGIFGYQPAQNTYTFRPSPALFSPAIPLGTSQR